MVLSVLSMQGRQIYTDKNWEYLKLGKNEEFRGAMAKGYTISLVVTSFQKSV